MLLGFKDQFAAYVEEGSKTHTFRVDRKRRPLRVGDVADCYAKPRQKGMRLLGRWPVVKVQRMRIAMHSKTELRVSIDGQILSEEEKGLFFLRDGFRRKGEVKLSVDGKRVEERQARSIVAIIDAGRFWKPQLEAGPISGQLIHWDYSTQAVRVGKKKGTK